MNAEQHEWYWKGYNDAKKYEQREFVGLTDDEAIFLIENEALERGDLLEAIEAKLKEKNTK